MPHYCDKYNLTRKLIIFGVLSFAALRFAGGEELDGGGVDQFSTVYRILDQLHNDRHWVP